MAVSDAIWARYISNISSSSKLASANWGALVVVFGAFVVISYVNDKRMILPAALGAWIGTYYGV